LRRLETADADIRSLYGHEAAFQESRTLWESTLHCFLGRFGDRDVRLFRSPGRLNLRGMHVDTHGGFLNLTTHQRETVVVAARADAPATTAVNANPAFPEVSFSLKALSQSPEFRMEWERLIAAPGVRARVEQAPGSWQNYVEGCALNVQHRLPGHPVPDLLLAVGSNLPQGASLSSSAALCIALVLAFSGWAGAEFSPEMLILSARDGEWYAGSRCGVSDQAAMVLGKPGQCVQIALRPDRLDVSSGRWYAFPDEMAVLVVNSLTERNLSGDALIAYTQNRFAYSMALHVCRQNLEALGMPPERVRGTETLPDLAPHALNADQGLVLLYRLLQRVPETLSLEALRETCASSELDALYARHFGIVPPSERPRMFPMRGPLLFGIAESERARLFPEAVETGDWIQAGNLMNIGHDGDRRARKQGQACSVDISDRALARMAAERIPIEQCPGVYGASTPALDALVDAAIGGGACGACLTGAGLGGSVLALCSAMDAPRLAERLKQTIASPEYAMLAGAPAPFPGARVRDCVVVNHAVAGACELLPYSELR
jgi:galactokinase